MKMKYLLEQLAAHQHVLQGAPWHVPQGQPLVAHQPVQQVAPRPCTGCCSTVLPTGSNNGFGVFRDESGLTKAGLKKPCFNFPCCLQPIVIILLIQSSTHSTVQAKVLPTSVYLAYHLSSTPLILVHVQVKFEDLKFGFEILKTMFQIIVFMCAIVKSQSKILNHFKLLFKCISIHDQTLVLTITNKK